ncbi:MAG: M56 family metallopeptidase, partial [Acidobacteriota bacterium]|nr:M56 family metallopeptidase [Acidobacteriota bacterium]
MSPDLVWSNVAAWCLQIGLLVGVAGFAPALLRLAHPRHRLAFWHILLLACVVLPLAAPWRRETIVVTPVTAPLPAVAPGAAIAVEHPVPWTRIALYALAAGAVLRLLWLAGGLWRLRVYRRRSTPLAPPLSWSVEADLRLSADVASPVTFGARRPVVLLPSRFGELDCATREAVLCHEILHVRRKDWLITLAEEVVRSVFWFHPAIWWLLGEIGLAREQAVDREVVEMTRAREEYVDALLAIAGAKPRLDLAPAPLFLRRRHLKHRIVSIMKEVRMSKTRSLSALAASLGILAAACWLVTMTFPLAAAPQMVADGPGVTVDLGGAAILH